MNVEYLHSCKSKYHWPVNIKTSVKFTNPTSIYYKLLCLYMQSSHILNDTNNNVKFQKEHNGYSEFV